MSLSYRDQTLWPIYITIKNLDTKIQQSQKRPKILLLSTIFIIYKQLKDVNNKDKDLKLKIYHTTLKTISQHTYPSFLSIELKKRDTNNIAALLENKESIKLVCAYGYKRPCYLVLVNVMVYYKEQVLITGIKVNMQCSICHVRPKEREIVTWLWEPQTHLSTWTQLK